jgi:hypothetical protein
MPYNITRHELIRACSVHLRLPIWLNEGVDAVPVDRSGGGPTIRWETLTFTKGFLPKGAPLTYRKLSRMGLDAITYQGIRGKWLVWNLWEKQPGVLRDL